MESGIYKITSPSGRIYVGQSENIKSRWLKYRNIKNLVYQPLIKNSISKYGYEAHIFEVIEYCEIEELNCRERHWQDFYDVLNGGLNCILQECGEQRRVLTEEHSKRLSERTSGENNPMFGVDRPPEWRLFMSELMKERFKDKTNHPMYGKQISEKQKEILLKSRLGSKASDETKKKMSDSHTGKIIDQQGRKNIAEGKLGEKNPMFGKFAELNKNSKVIINTIDSSIIYGVAELSRITGISKSYLKDMLHGYRINNTTYLFLDVVNDFLNIFITGKTKEDVFSKEELEFISNNSYTNITKRGKEFLTKYLMYCDHKFLKM